MSRIIQKIPLDRATPGMVLAEEAVSSSGIALLRHGTTLTEKHLASLRLHEVGEIGVFAAPGEPDASTDSEIRASLETEKNHVERLFRHARINTTMEALYRAVLEFRLERIR